MLLVFGIWLLNQENICPEDLHLSAILLQKFVMLFDALYGEFSDVIEKCPVPQLDLWCSVILFWLSHVADNFVKHTCNTKPFCHATCQ